MALSPKRVKYRKIQRGRVKGNATRCNHIDFGEFALVSLEPFWLTNRQLEAARVALNRKVKRGGKLWIRVFPDKGKGAPEYWVAVVRPGTVLFELTGIDRSLAEEAMRLAGSKLPFKTRFAEQPREN